MVDTLIINERQIRQDGRGSALRACWRQWRAERRLARRGIHFRDTNMETVANAYRAMSLAEFEAINGRQDWANWRTIPRAMSGHIPDRPLSIVDLGCGTGSSTRVLAWYAPAGSRITGYELAEPLLALARRRDYRNRAGQAAQVDFVCQGATQTLRERTGGIIPEYSVDLVNASGVVGHHLNAATVSPLIAEIRRISGRGGMVMLDVGPSLGGPELRRLMSAANFEFLGHYRSGWWDPTGEMVFRGPDS
ncbi:MAG TPA: methyltransferase domain-containing protein [Gemmataceae bacterium]|jgi:SAM-dependent methyltransferase|nr:methyltransferase domain-containing protein [Gemmataceae bacterium]